MTENADIHVSPNVTVTLNKLNSAATLEHLFTSQVLCNPLAYDFSLKLYFLPISNLKK